MTYTVYLDEVLLGNWLMNFAILWVTARLGRLQTSGWRLAVASGIGALYALVLFFPSVVNLGGVFGKIAVSLLMVAVTFAPSPARKLTAALLIFYLASFSMGGLVFGVGYFLGGSASYQVYSGIPDFPRLYFWPSILTALAITWLVGRIGGTYLKQRLVKSLLNVPVVLTIYGKRIPFTALMDTGNQLSDPLTQQPVIVVELSAIREALPVELLAVLENQDEPDPVALVEAMQDHRWSNRLRLIPYRSLGKSGGMLVGFRPDKVELMHGGQMVTVERVVVALYHRRLSETDDYRALLSPKILDSLPDIA